MQNSEGFIQIEGTSETTAANSGKRYWRSLNELAGTPAFLEWVKNEFPSTADEMLTGTSRRTVLKLMAASFGLAGLTACRRPVDHIVPFVKGVEEYIPGRPMYYATAMSIGGGATGLLVETNNGRPTKIEGNPDHPFSLGASNAFHQASILSLYDADRLRSVRSGGQTRKWEEFVAYVRREFDRGKLGSGASFRILSESVNSPSLDALRKHVLSTFPQAKWVEYEAISPDGAAGGAQLAFGHSVTPLYNFEKADVVLSLDSDFLFLDAGGTVLPMKQFGRRRRAGSEQGELNRLYVVEGKHSVTGGAADHRLRMRPSEIPHFAAALAGRLGAGGNQLQVLNESGGDATRSRWLNVLVKDLNGRRGRSLVIAGPRQPAVVHALAFQINQALGNVGNTVTYVQPPAPADPRPQVERLRELGREMAEGRVTHLVMLGANPVYTAPADLELEANVEKVANSVYLAPEYDETAAVSKWAVPQAHFLEAWGDVAAPDGTVTIQQPAIQPLHGGKSAIEFVALLTGYQYQSAHDIVRSVWMPKFGGDPKDTRRPIVPGASPSPPGQPGPTDYVYSSPSPAEKTWRKVLHNGIVPNTAYPAANVTVNAAAVGQAVQSLPRTGQLELIFEPDAKLYDGRYANNGWMQELPDPMTKLTWDNAALLSPKTARDLGVVIGDVVSLERAGRKIEAPVMIQPGQVDNLIVISLGYGRKQCGRVGKGVGTNAYLIRTINAMNVAGDIRVSKTSRKYAMALTEEHHIIHDLGAPEVQKRAQALVRELPIEEYRKEPAKVKEMVEVPELFQLYGTPADYTKGNQWGMAIDLNACTGCNACVVACQAENNVPVVGKEQVARGREMHWLRLDRYYKGDEETAEAVSQPVLCMHCETAPCENVCPVAATVHSAEGLNEMAYNRCVGTRYCSNNCPYKVRRFNYLNFHKDVEEVQKMMYNPDVTVRMRGVMEKCTYCVQRIQEKKIELKAKERRSWITDRDDVLTACQQTCPSEAIVFGNINDPGSRVAQLKKLPRNYGMLEELNTRPRTSYLARLRNPNPELEAQHG